MLEEIEVVLIGLRNECKRECAFTKRIGRYTIIGVAASEYKGLHFLTVLAHPLMFVSSRIRHPLDIYLRGDEQAQDDSAKNKYVNEEGAQKN